MYAGFTNDWSYRVGEWDTHLRSNQADITALADQVQRLLLAQEELRRTMVRRNAIASKYILPAIRTYILRMFVLLQGNCKFRPTRARSDLVDA